MRFYLFDTTIREDGKVPLTTTNKHRGCLIVNCPVCKTRGLLGKNRIGKVDVEILVRDIAPLEDIEQASTVLLASKKFRDAICSAGLTGVEFYPPVGYITNGRMPRYHEVIRQCKKDIQFKIIHVTGKGGSVTHTSGVRLIMSCDVCGWKQWSLPENGFVIDESQWDGSDFFHVVEYGPFFLSERAVKVLDQANLSNFFAQLSTDYRPGKLPDYTVKKY